jgi:hypothetical protein
MMPVIMPSCRFVERGSFLLTSHRVGAWGYQTPPERSGWQYPRRVPRRSLNAASFWPTQSPNRCAVLPGPAVRARRPRANGGHPTSPTCRLSARWRGPAVYREYSSVGVCFAGLTRATLLAQQRTARSRYRAEDRAARPESPGLGTHASLDPAAAATPRPRRNGRAITRSGAADAWPLSVLTGTVLAGSSRAIPPL